MSVIRPSCFSPLGVMLISLACGSVAVACGSDKSPVKHSEVDVFEVETGGEHPACPPPRSARCTFTTVPSYARDVAPIVHARCAVCHTGEAGKPWSLSTQGGLADWSHFTLDALAVCAMPPPDSGVILLGSERATLWKWLVCGSPNN